MCLNDRVNNLIEIQTKYNRNFLRHFLTVRYALYFLYFILQIILWIIPYDEHAWIHTNTFSYFILQIILFIYLLYLFIYLLICIYPEIDAVESIHNISFFVFESDAVNDIDTLSSGADEVTNAVIENTVFVPFVIGHDKPL